MCVWVCVCVWVCECVCVCECDCEGVICKALKRVWPIAVGGLLLLGES